MIKLVKKKELKRCDLYLDHWIIQKDICVSVGRVIHEVGPCVGNDGIFASGHLGGIILREESDDDKG